jgi:serine/threonine protein kinase
MPGDEATLLASALLRTLGYLHENGIVHRDVKASNVFVADDRRVILLDLGLAQDAYEMYGWTAETVFTFEDVQARWTEFDEVMKRGWRRHPPSVRKALCVVVKGARRRWVWSIDIIMARLEVMDALSDSETADDESDGETDVEA